MASIAKDKSGNRRILFYAPDGARKTIRLGKCSQRQAEGVKLHVEALLSDQFTGDKPSRQTSTWLTEIDISLRQRLERAELVAPEIPEPVKPALTMDAFLTEYLERRRDKMKPATVVVWQQAMDMLRENLPDGIALCDVTKGHAKGVLDNLQGKLAPTTIQKRIGFAKQFFQDAVDWELITVNPFASLKVPNAGGQKSNVEVTREIVEKVLLKCNSSWKLIVVLCRYGGLRCPSEVLSLKWEHVDWEAGKLHVPEPKVEHHAGRGIRSIPLFPELRDILDQAWAAAPDGAVFVVDKPAYRHAAMGPGGWRNANLRTQFLKILDRAGVQPWPRLFHSMRASRQTELERDFPRHVVCAWMGNTESVAEKHYLLVAYADWQKATAKPEPKSGAKSGAVNCKSGSKSGSAQVRKENAQSRKHQGKQGKNSLFPCLPGFEEWRRGESNPRPVIFP